MKLWDPKVKKKDIEAHKVCLDHEPILTEEAQGGEDTRLSLKACMLVLILSEIYHISLNKCLFSRSLCLLKNKEDTIDPSSL